MLNSLNPTKEISAERGEQPTGIANRTSINEFQLFSSLIFVSQRLVTNDFSNNSTTPVTYIKFPHHTPPTFWGSIFS